MDRDAFRQKVIGNSYLKIESSSLPSHGVNAMLLGRQRKGSYRQKRNALT